jgi:hypothetical protein
MGSINRRFTEDEDVEGHGGKARAIDEDVEGHGGPGRRLTEDEDVEGHGGKFRSPAARGE